MKSSEAAFEVARKYRVIVLRLGHRVQRDARVTTHVGLTARAFGADGMLIAGLVDKGVEGSIRGVIENWGGAFEIASGVNWADVIDDWKKKDGEIIHLTMYGVHLNLVINEIRGSSKDKLVVVGAEKVPGKVFHLADYNVAIGSQPHSEVAALAVFLDRLFQGKWEELNFKDAIFRVIPSKSGKKLFRVRNRHL